MGLNSNERQFKTNPIGKALVFGTALFGLGCTMAKAPDTNDQQETEERREASKSEEDTQLETYLYRLELRHAVRDRQDGVKPVRLSAFERDRNLSKFAVKKLGKEPFEKLLGQIRLSALDMSRDVPHHMGSNCSGMEEITEPLWKVIYPEKAYVEKVKIKIFSYLGFYSNPAYLEMIRAGETRYMFKVDAINQKVQCAKVPTPYRGEAKWIPSKEGGIIKISGDMGYEFDVEWREDIPEELEWEDMSWVTYTDLCRENNEIDISRNGCDSWEELAELGNEKLGYRPKDKYLTLPGRHEEDEER